MSVDHPRPHGVSPDVDRRPESVKQPVNSQYGGYTVRGQPHGLQYQHHGYQPGLWNASVAVTTISTCPPKDTSIPEAWAMNITATAS